MNLHLKLPEREDFMNYAEGVPLDPQLQKRIQQLLASNAEMRQSLAVLRRDLYHIDCQIPQVPLPVETAAEIAKLAQVWAAKNSVNVALPRFWERKDFWILVGYWIGFSLLAFGILSHFR